MNVKRIRVECLAEDCRAVTMAELSQEGANGERRVYSVRLPETGWKIVGHTPGAAHFACPRHGVTHANCGSHVELNGPAFLVVGLTDAAKMLETRDVEAAKALLGELRETADRLLAQHRLWQEAGVVVPTGLGWTDLLRREAGQRAREGRDAPGAQRLAPLTSDPGPRP